MKTFSQSLLLPMHCVSTLATFWCSENPDLILRESVREWLDQNDIAFEITYADNDPDQCDECDECDHFIGFLNHYDAIAFKLRWF